jgi:hypothetical protein
MNRKNLVNPGTVNREVGLLRSMLNLAVEWFDLEMKPIKYVMAKEEPSKIEAVKIEAVHDFRGKF